MTLLLRQTRLKHTGRVNALVMLLMLLVVGGHCSVAMAKVQLEAMPDMSMPAMPGHGAHCDGNNPADDFSDTGHCMDDSCPNSATLLQSQASKLNPQKFEQVAWVVPLPAYLPPTRAGPCDTAQRLDYDLSAGSPAPLYYALCVLRL